MNEEKKYQKKQQNNKLFELWNQALNLELTFQY